MRKTLILAAAFLMLAAGTVFAADTADIIFVVDESGSMAGEHAWIGNMIGDLEAGLIAAGVGDISQGDEANRYGLVGFGSIGHDLPGGPSQEPHSHLVGGADFGTASDLQTAAGTLVTDGGFEDGWAAINYAMNNYTFRSDAAVNIVLITDEDRDVSTPDTYASTLSALGGALLNVVVNNPFGSDDTTGRSVIGRFADGKDLNPEFDADGNPVPGGTAAIENAILADGSGGYVLATGATTGNGFGNTETEYVAMALENGGGAWNLNILRAGGLPATSFTAAFVDFKVEEIKGQPPIGTPEPGTMGLLGFGLLAIIGLRRRFIR
jgi:hypothetical protein